jgi:hypothetical protein
MGRAKRGKTAEAAYSIGIWDFEFGIFNFSPSFS